jgi:hypothetical protein
MNYRDTPVRFTMWLPGINLNEAEWNALQTKDSVSHRSDSRSSRAALRRHAQRRTNATQGWTAYPCHHCGLFHLGHLRRKPVAVQAAPPVKQPTAGDLRRAAKRAAKGGVRKAARAELYQGLARNVATHRMAD